MFGTLWRGLGWGEVGIAKEMSGQLLVSARFTSVT